MPPPSLEDSRTWSQFDQAPSVPLCHVWVLDHVHGFTILPMSPYHWRVLDCFLPPFQGTPNVCLSLSLSLFLSFMCGFLITFSVLGSQCHTLLSVSSRSRSQFHPAFHDHLLSLVKSISVLTSTRALPNASFSRTFQMMVLET